RFGARDGVAVGRAAEGAPGQYPYADDADACSARVLEELAVVLRRVVGGQGASGRGVQHVVDDLSAAEHAGIDDLLQGCGLADSGQSEEPQLAGGAERLEGGCHLL